MAAKRRNSQEEIVKGDVQRQNSNNSANRGHNLSEEGHAGKREGGSVFSDTMSNPDADEIYFWKQKERTAVAPTGFAFNIGPPIPASNLRL